MTSEKLFDTLKDGAWHSLNELAVQIGVSIDKLVKYSRQLAKQGIIQHDEGIQRIKIEPEWRLLLPDETKILTNSE